MSAKILCRALIAYGPVLVSGLYITWIIARLSLGYWPRPSLDDPKDIAWVAVPRLLTMVLVLLWPVAVVAGGVAAAWAWHTNDPERKKRAFEAVLGLGVLTPCIWFMRSDPFRVALWFMD